MPGAGVQSHGSSRFRGSLEDADQDLGLCHWVGRGDGQLLQLAVHRLALLPRCIQSCGTLLAGWSLGSLIALGAGGTRVTLRSSRALISRLTCRPGFALRSLVPSRALVAGGSFRTDAPGWLEEAPRRLPRDADRALLARDPRRPLWALWPPVPSRTDWSPVSRLAIGNGLSAEGAHLVGKCRVVRAGLLELVPEE